MPRNISNQDNQRLEEAILFATKCHSGQVRKGSSIPYILHPLEAMQILAEMNGDTNLLIAGLLHDVVEDTDTGIDEIRDKFGDDVVHLVAAHSEDKSKTWQERKEAAIEEAHLAEPHLKKLILSDKLANIRSMYKNYNEIGDKLWERFNAGKEKQEWYYGELVKALADLKEDKDAKKHYAEFESLYLKCFGKA